MTESEIAPDRDPQRWGKWAGTVDHLITYRYLGCRSAVVDQDHATGRMPLRSDMRCGAGLLGTPLAIAMLDTAGINIDGRYFCALTHIALQVVDDGAGVHRIRTDGRVLHAGRTQVFTDAVLADETDPERVVALGSADWVNLGPVAPGWTYTDPGEGVPDRPPMPPLAEPYQLETGPAGGYVIPRLTAVIGAEILHHGPLMVALESHATDLATSRLPAPRRQQTGLRLATFDVRIVRPGKFAPFVTRGRVIGRSASALTVRTELVDRGGDGAIIATAALSYVPQGA